MRRNIEGTRCSKYPMPRRSRGSPGAPAFPRDELRSIGSRARHSVTSEIAVSLPAHDSPRAEPYPLLPLFDEDAYLSLVSTPIILDNVISERRIPPILALLIGNAPGARDRELPCNPEFSQALVTELLPGAHSLYNFTSDPHKTVVAGSSAGGLAAPCSGLWHPEALGNVFAQSGAFHWTLALGSNAADSNSEPSWVARQFISSPRSPCAFTSTLGARNSTPRELPTASCSALALYAMFCEPRVTMCIFKSSRVDTTISAGGAHWQMA
jgi:enterochelin esterase family protein